MNAPVTPSLENIDLFRNILTSDYIDETLERNQLIKRNRQHSVERLTKVSEDCHSMSRELDNLRGNLHNLSGSFDELGQSWMKNKAVHQEMVQKMRAFSQELQKTADLIRQNLDSAKQRA